MATEFIMPQLGLTMTEGTISKWFKNVGDPVAVGDLLVEVETEKISNQLESTLQGTILEILVPEGGIAPVKAPIVVIGAPGEKVERSAGIPTVVTGVEVAENACEVSAPPEPSRHAGSGRIMASPYAKKIAKEQKIDLGVVTGTGPGGRVVERDVVGFIERNKIRTTPLAAKVAEEFSVDLSAIKKESRIMKEDVLAMASAKGSATDSFQPLPGVPVSGMRKVISERMSMSWQTSPHVNMTVEVDMSAATDLKNILSKASGQKVSFTEIIIKCASLALTEYKTVNASLIAGRIYTHEVVNVGVAVALDDGLIVPVIKNAAYKTVKALRDEISKLSQKARQGTLTPDEVESGTFTVTNLGMFGVDQFTPIINQPESAILGVCRIVERPVVVEGAIVIRPMMNLCLSFDHRLIDGAVGAKFLARLRQLLEQPLLLI